jgi:outer membrane protein TolC
MVNARMFARVCALLWKSPAQGSALPIKHARRKHSKFPATRKAEPALCGLLGAALGGFVIAQTPAPTITLADALQRARMYGGQVQSANLAVLQAGEDLFQAQKAHLPTVNAFNQYINTQGNGTPSGTYVANDGVHVYNEQAVVHEEALMLVRHGELNRAMAAEAVARAKVDVAARGLNATVIQNYYAIVSAQRKAANTETSVAEADRFVDITQKQEKAGEAARADVIKAQIPLRQLQRDLQDAQVSVEKAKIALGVLIFPDFSTEFSVADDLEQPAMLPPMAEAQTQATASSPDLRVASASITEAGYDTEVARYGYLPSLGIDLFYGFDANQLTVKANRPDAEGRVASRTNLGYVAQVTLNVPVWNWGATRSKIKQAEQRQTQAQADLKLAQKTLQGNVAGAYAEARGALAQLDSLRESVTLATESLRLTVIRYQAGEATAFEVVDSQNTLTQARNGLNDGLARYRIALATLETLTGTL